MRTVRIPCDRFKANTCKARRAVPMLAIRSRTIKFHQPGIIHIVGERRINRLQVNIGPAHISTSYVERQNLTMRMSVRRFTRLTNGFSKKIENHAHAVALHFLWHNFGRIRKTLRVTPAMEAGVAESPWNLPDVVAMPDDLAPKPRRRGTY